MSDDEKEKVPEGFTSTTEGVETNHEVGQTPDQFFDGARERAAADENVPASHATKGMTSLGFTEASRIEDTAAAQERDRKDAERAAAKAERSKV